MMPSWRPAEETYGRTNTGLLRVRGGVGSRSNWQVMVEKDVERGGGERGKRMKEEKKSSKRCSFQRIRRIYICT